MQDVFGGFVNKPTTGGIGGGIGGGITTGTPPIGGQPPTPTIDEERLLKLKKLYELKVITKEQYDIKGAEILKSI